MTKKKEWKGIFYKGKKLEGLGELIDIALKAGTKKVAKELFQAYLDAGCKPEIAKSNLGYMAGYYDSKTARKIWKLFECAHPIFGTTYP